MPTAPSRRSEGMESNVFPLNVQSICFFFLCFRTFVPWSLCALVPALWAGDGVACACAVPLEDEVESVPSVVWCAGVVCRVPVDLV